MPAAVPQAPVLGPGLGAVAETSTSRRLNEPEEGAKGLNAVNVKVERSQPEPDGGPRVVIQAKGVITDPTTHRWPLPSLTPRVRGIPLGPGARTRWTWSRSTWSEARPRTDWLPPHSWLTVADFQQTVAAPLKTCEIEKEIIHSVPAELGVGRARRLVPKSCVLSFPPSPLGNILTGAPCP